MIENKDISTVEEAFHKLMYQFRHIDYKYGLMVNGEINSLYDQRKQSICKYEERVGVFAAMD